MKLIRCCLVLAFCLSVVNAHSQSKASIHLISNDGKLRNASSGINVSLDTNLIFIDSCLSNGSVLAKVDWSLCDSLDLSHIQKGNIDVLTISKQERPNVHGAIYQIVSDSNVIVKLTNETVQKGTSVVRYTASSDTNVLLNSLRFNFRSYNNPKFILNPDYRIQNEGYFIGELVIIENQSKEYISFLETLLALKYSIPLRSKYKLTDSLGYFTAWDSQDSVMSLFSHNVSGLVNDTIEGINVFKSRAIYGTDDLEVGLGLISNNPSLIYTDTILHHQEYLLFSPNNSQFGDLELDSITYNSVHLKSRKEYLLKPGIRNLEGRLITFQFPNLPYSQKPTQIHLQSIPDSGSFSISVDTSLIGNGSIFTIAADSLLKSEFWVLSFFWDLSMLGNSQIASAPNSPQLVTENGGTNESETVIKQLFPSYFNQNSTSLVAGMTSDNLNLHSTNGCELTEVIVTDGLGKVLIKRRELKIAEGFLDFPMLANGLYRVILVYKGCKPLVKNILIKN